jgi:murein DD-endopeptidase MepM/ murein hydrolase activator NlpD
MSRSLRLLVVALAVTAAATWLADAPAAGQATVVTYRPPVDAPVIDPFRAPTSPYGPGNRGIEYATVPGSVVRTVAPGSVSFAGMVAGTRYVTVTHADGLRSSYGGLASISVAQGAELAAGAEVGRAGHTLHLGIRRGEEYLDPEALFAAAAPLVRLIPVEDFDAAAAG